MHPVAPNSEFKIQNSKLILALSVAAALACGKPDPARINYRLPPPNPTQTFHLGAQVKDLVLTDISETTSSIEDYRGRVVVLEFWSCRCPFVARSEQARQRLIAQYAPRGVVYLAIDSNRDEYPEEIRRYLADQRSSCTVIADYTSAAARRFNATRTPQAFVINRDGIVCFGGDPFSPRQWAKPQPERADWLEAALEAVFAGRPPDPASPSPSGSRIRPYRGL